mmetsp:Transcript_14781/g.23121  ORF Transcript_14781/g.23121 Transcript_14781/m.23121 type:complete len:226 (+) Transcript_14781:215-892(+)|eukprot:CAMPEP_0195292514 /NCGR_PEP_ID=MMETSP0707-20130614/9889_1 /TAXON_ID=33640 /ORGANISM="Asterionellopsis glacialis, Strain CCMP134" /LENGTH=225 /DNA_ID=CAMNT_0040352993 /DNA_START=107 /DNA_END=784 /DNA_ORIENTATION=+
MKCVAALVLLLSTSTQAFVGPKLTSYRYAPSELKAKSDDVVNQRAFAVGTFVEFHEKKRVHVGKIVSLEHKSNGGARYTVESEGKNFNIADKAVDFAMACPNSPGQAEKLYHEFEEAQHASDQEIRSKLDISPELLEMAWQEAEENESHTLTPDSLIELVHSHAASAIEKYMAWKLLKSDMAHIFFKDLKDHGRVVAFKAKTQNAVDVAKDVFCRNHDDEEYCYV